jgi:hypothetical protein
MHSSNYLEDIPPESFLFNIPASLEDPGLRSSILAIHYSGTRAERMREKTIFFISVDIQVPFVVEFP